MSYDFLFKIIFVGDTSVGKTALAERITKNEFKHHYDATIGVDFSTITMDIDDKLIKTHIWDTAGQECFSSIISTYYRGIAGAVIVFDVGRDDSFQKCRYWLEQILNKGTIGHTPCLFLIGNKTDKQYRAVSKEKAEEFAKENNMVYCETSARHNINVKEFYKSLIETIYTTTDLEKATEQQGIRKGMITHSKIQEKEERDCIVLPCCNIL